MIYKPNSNKTFIAVNINEAQHSNPSYNPAAKGISRKNVEDLLKEKKTDFLSISNYDQETEKGKSEISKRAAAAVTKILPKGASLSKRHNPNQMTYFEIVNSKYEGEFHFGNVCELRLQEKYGFRDEGGDYTDKDWHFNYSTSGGDFSQDGYLLRLKLLGETVNSFKTSISTFNDLAKEYTDYWRDRLSNKKELEAKDPSTELVTVSRDYFSSLFNGDLKAGSTWKPRNEGENRRWILEDNSRRGGRRRGRSYWNNVVDEVKIIKVKPKTISVEYTYHYEGKNGEREDERSFTSEVNNSRGHLFSMWMKHVMDPKNDVKTGFDGIKWSGFSSPKAMLSEYV